MDAGVPVEMRKEKGQFNVRFLHKLDLMRSFQACGCAEEVVVVVVVVVVATLDKWNELKEIIAG